MAIVLAAGQRIPVDEYEANPAAFAHALRAARAQPGYALCCCRDPAPQLVIRTLKQPAGDERFILATWPNRGTAHAADCRFSYTLEEWQDARASRAAAIRREADGRVEIHPRFSLRRQISAGERSTPTLKTDRDADPAAVPHPPAAARPVHDSVDLDGLFAWLWQEAGLCAPASATLRRWSEVVAGLAPVLERARLATTALASVLYVVPVFTAEDKAEIHGRYELWLRSHARTETYCPQVLVLGEVRETKDMGRFLLTRLKHHAPALFMHTRLARSLAARYPRAESALTLRAAGDTAAPRVVALFLAEVTEQGNLWINDAVLRTMTANYVPVDDTAGE